MGTFLEREPFLSGIALMFLFAVLYGFGTSLDTPVVAFTAHAQDSDAQNYRSNGFRDVLTKPAGPSVLREFLIPYVNISS